MSMDLLNRPGDGAQLAECLHGMHEGSTGFDPHHCIKLGMVVYSLGSSGRLPDQVKATFSYTLV